MNIRKGNILLGFIIIVILGNISYDTYYSNTIIDKLDTLYNDTIAITQVEDSVITQDVVIDLIYNNFKQADVNTLVNIESVKTNNIHNNYVTKPYHVNNAGKNLIKDFEKCRLTAYVYTNHKTGYKENYPTIGWGHVIYPGDKTPHRITRAQADRLFDKDMHKYEKMCDELLSELDPRFKFTQGFINGMVSFIYNCGKGGARNSQFFKRLKACRFDKNGNVNKADFEYAIEGIKHSKVYEPGHKPRRVREYKMIKN